MREREENGKRHKIRYKKVRLLFFAVIVISSMALGEGWCFEGSTSAQAAEGTDAGDRRTAPEIADIVERGRLRVAIPKQDLVAFFQEDETGELCGIDIELAEAIADSLGVEVFFDRTSDSYDELTVKLENHEVDMVIATYSHSLERIKYVDFSEPYLELQFGIMVNKQEMVRHDIRNNPVPYLKKHQEKLAVVEGTSHVELAKQLFPVCEIVETDDYDTAVSLVKAGEVFGFFSGELEFYSKYIAQPELLIYTSTYTFSDIRDRFCIGIPREKGQLLDYVNLYLESSPKITVDDVQERYRDYFRGEEVLEKR